MKNPGTKLSAAFPVRSAAAAEIASTTMPAIDDVAGPRCARRTTRSTTAIATGAMTEGTTSRVIAYTTMKAIPGSTDSTMPRTPPSAFSRSTPVGCGASGSAVTRSGPPRRPAC